MRKNTSAKVYTNIYMFLLPFLLVLLSGCKKSQKPPFVAFSKVQAAARDNEALDEMPKHLSNPSKISFNGHAIVSVASAVVFRDGSLVILDPRSGIFRFDQSGKFLNAFGSVGMSPGQFQVPAGITDVNDQLGVVDFVAHRVTIFSLDGKLQSSFIYSRQQFSSSQIGYIPTSKTFVLYGNKWSPGPNSHTRAADLMNIYDVKGSYVKSILPMPDRFDDLDLFGSDQVFMSRTDDGQTTFSLPFSYSTYTFGSQGASQYKMTQFDAPSTFHMPPSKFDENDLTDREARYEAWMLDWTPIVASWKRDSVTYFEYQTWSPLRYTIDVWDDSNRKLLTSIHTNYKYVTASGSKTVYVKDLTSQNQQPELLLGDIK